MDSLTGLMSTWASRDLAAESVSLDGNSFVLSLLAAILVGLSLHALYRLYFKENEPQDGSLARSLIMLTPALTAIFWMIQTSIVLSLGLLGSMSFVRFRTPVKRSEDVTFIVLALASAIGCATQNYPIVIALMAVFFAFTFIRNKLGYLFSGHSKVIVLTFNTKDHSFGDALRAELGRAGMRFEMISCRSYDGVHSFVMNVKLGPKTEDSRVMSICAAVDADAQVNIFYPSDRLAVG